MKMRKMVIVLLAFVALNGLCAKVIYVAPHGMSGADGSEISPLGSIQAGIDLSAPGDTVYLLPGVYYERIHLGNGSKTEQSITLKGSRDAVIDAAYPDTLHWTPAFDVAEGVYFAPTPGDVAVLVCDGKLINMLNYRRVTPENINSRLSQYAARREKNPALLEVMMENFNLVGSFSYPVIFQRGVGKRGWENVKAVGMYHPVRGGVLIKFGDGTSPENMCIFASPRVPAIKIQGAGQVTVSGLVIRHAWIGVEISDSSGTVIENCRIKAGGHGVQVISGASHCIVRGNEISQDLFSGNSPSLPGSWDTWVLHKSCGFWDHIGIWMRDSVGFHRIHDNYIHNHWGGIQESGKGNAYLEVYRNYIESITDDGLEPNGEGVHCAWHDNIVVDARCACRLKSIGRGPSFFYRNIFMRNKIGFRIFKPSSEGAEVYVYHNTCDSTYAYKNNKVLTVKSQSRYNFFNNFFYCRTYFAKTSSSVGPGWLGDHNVFVRRGGTDEWNAGRKIAEEHNQEQASRWSDSMEPGFVDYLNDNLAITQYSIAREAGGCFLKIRDIVLPGTKDKYYPGEKPDCGALQYGETMPDLRSRHRY